MVETGIGRVSPSTGKDVRVIAHVWACIDNVNCHLWGSTSSPPVPFCLLLPLETSYTPSDTSLHFMVATLSLRCAVKRSIFTRSPNVPSALFHTNRISSSLRTRSLARSLVLDRRIPLTMGEL